MRLGQAGYTRFIRITKLVLPLVAIGLLATVFLFTNDDELEGGFNFSKTELESLESGMRVEQPRMFGSNASGDVYNFVADTLIPDALIPSLVEVRSVYGEIEYLSGLNVQIFAGKADFLIDSRSLRLSEDAQITTSDGFRIRTEELLAELDSGLVSGDQGLVASSPMGEIEAGAFRIERVGADDEEKQMLWFENGVMLSFKPESWKGKEATSE